MLEKDKSKRKNKRKEFLESIDEKQWRKDHHRGGYDVRKMQQKLHQEDSTSKESNEDIEK